MAAPYVTVVRTALKGVHLVPRRRLLTPRSQTPAACRCPRIRVSPAAPLCGSRTEPRPPNTAGVHTDKRAGEGDEKEAQVPEYIPRRQGKNPMKKIGYAWMIGLPVGIISFLLAKRQVDKNRLKQLKIRQRMNRSNEGEYEGSRYRNPAESAQLDK